MEFLPILAEYTIKPIGRQLGYVVHCRTNLQNLQNKVEELKATRQTIENRIAEATRKGEEIQPDVSLWRRRVAEITAQTDELLNDESQAKLKCLNGCCPNLTARHQISRKSKKLVKDVEEYGKKEFPQVSCATRRKEVLDVTEKGYQDFQSRMSIVKQVMDSLKESVVRRVGVYGLGGVGKTTLAKEVYRQASEDKNLFDNVVILLDVKGNPDEEAIQKKIVEKLGMDILPTETIEGRASRLCDRIQEKKILIILDDVQEKIELEHMGVPCLPTCKVLLTCRSREVLVPHKMNADRVFPLDLLDKEETWSLFENKAGEVVKHNGLIRNVAIQVAEKCGGLPLLIITVASVLKENENIHVWKNALRQLKGFDKEDSTETAYLTLEWSYEQMRCTELQQLFLLCGFMVRENHVYVGDLLKYGLGLGLFTSIETVEDAHDKLEALLARLKDFCLLLDGETGSSRRRVRMHDLVCLVANRIARRGEQVLSTEYRGDLKEWPDNGSLRKCTKFSLILRSINNLPELSLECPEVELFCLEGEYSRAEVNIPSNFLSEMQKLKVLVFTKMHMPSLPLSSQYLKTLQTLCLKYCRLKDITLFGQLGSLEVLSLEGSNLEKLPREIAQLTHLRLLDLSECSQLRVIPPNVISSLVRLEELKMRNSFRNWEMEGARAKSNASLSELKHLSQLSALEVCIPKADFLPANLFSDKLTRYNILIGYTGGFDDWLYRRVNISFGYPRGHGLLKKKMVEVTLNTVKLELTINNNIELDEGLKSLLKRTEDLSLHEGATSIVQQLDPKYYENLKHLQLLRNNFESTYIINTKVVWPNLVTLTVHGCHKSIFLFSSSTARSLVRLEQLEISGCGLMQEIVTSTGECSEGNTDNMFPKLKVLKLEQLPNLTRFGKGNYIEFPAMENMKIDECAKIVEFIGDKVATCSRDTRTTYDVKGKNILFDGKVGFPHLTTLSIRFAHELKAIWDVPHDRLKSFDCQNLDSIVIDDCRSLKQVFPASVARGLQNLTLLRVSYCFSIGEIVGEEEDKEGLETIPPHFIFPKVTKVELLKLPRLSSLYPKTHVSSWPLLKQLEVTRCDKVRTLFTVSEKKKNEANLLTSQSTLCDKVRSLFRDSQEKKNEVNHLTSQSTLFSIDYKDSFPSLENLYITEMEIWNGPIQAIQSVFGKLKSITFYGKNWAPFSEQASFLFLQRLQNLEEIEVFRNDCLEIIVDEGISSSSDPGEEETHDDDGVAVSSGALPRVRTLKLSSMYLLMHLGNDDSSRSPLFPNLEILQLIGCPRLKKSIESSAISFRNLTSLEVVGCHRLEYLTSYSVAKSLVQLKTLKVENCKRIEVIVSGNGDDAAGGGNDIYFSRLQLLQLTELESLQRFYSGNCTLKFPSSMKDVTGTGYTARQDSQKDGYTTK